MPVDEPKPNMGRGFYAVGYVALAPWGCVVAAAVALAVAFVGRLAAGSTANDALRVAMVAALLTGLPIGVVRYRYRHRLEATWQRFRNGELRPGR